MDISAILLTRQEMEEKLSRAFVPEQTDTLVEVLDVFREAELQRAADTRELKQGLAALTQEVRNLAAAQARTEQGMEELRAAIRALTETQAETAKQLQSLGLAQAETAKQLQSLGLAQAETAKQLQSLGFAQAAADIKWNDMRGWQLELRYQQRAAAYLGGILRRTRVHTIAEIEQTLEARLSDDEIKDLLQLDLLVSGQPWNAPAREPVWLAMEVSATIDVHDVERAVRRAQALHRAGYLVVPAVAGERVGEGVEEAARSAKVLLVQDGKALFWEEAYQRALAA